MEKGSPGRMNMLWAKCSKENGSEWHSLINHLLDSGAVCQELWNACLSLSFRNQLSTQFGMNDQDMGTLLSFWVSLHDIGKAGPEFQKKNSLLATKIKEEGFYFPEERIAAAGFHATATTIILRRLFTGHATNMPRRFCNILAKTLGGHHGQFPDEADLVDFGIEHFHVGDETWQESQKEIFLQLQDIIRPSEVCQFPDGLEQTNPLMLLVVGLCTVADWIASNVSFFPYEHAFSDYASYFEKSKAKARNALRNLGWVGWHSSNQPLPFGALFPHIPGPNSIQNAVIALADHIHSPFLMIIESQTGSGKTEAALYLADTILQRESKAGLYIAMPTQATSNQMFRRVSDFLSERYSSDQINLHLVHGKALLWRAQEAFEPSGIFSDDGQAEGNIHSHAWFLPRKRTLLAPFGVGTVDQTFLAVLRSKYFFLRLFGLSHKVVIFDEVHAYDIYMTEIFKTLLGWLKAVGTSVIILTATLPQQKRLELLQAFSGLRDKPAPQPFPRISLATETAITVMNADDGPSRDVKLSWIDREPETIVNYLRGSLSEGGCAAVICNTVNRSQEVFQAIKAAFKGQNIEILLFHSRFPFCWRKEIEENVLRMFGKDHRERPNAAILVSTQVIEQSLDLDFDLIVSDLAPIDLLIQRIGRLHRHHSPEGRPTSLMVPTCVLGAYSSVLETLKRGGDRFVYEPYILAKTYSALERRAFLRLPEETDALIQQVYDSEDADSEEMRLAREKMEKNNRESQTNADNYLIPSRDKDFLGSLKTFFGDDTQSLSRTVLNAPTREIDPSLQVVCIEEDPQGTRLVGTDQVIDLTQPLSEAQINQCLNAEVNLTDKVVIGRVLETSSQIPESFKSVATLRWHIPLVFRDGVCILSGDRRITIDKEVGIRIEKTIR